MPHFGTTIQHALTLSATSKLCSSSVKSLLSSCTCQRSCQHSCFTQSVSLADVYVAWNRTHHGDCLGPKCCHDAWMSQWLWYIFHSHSCVVGDDTDKARGVNVSVSGASGSHSLTFIIFQTLQVYRPHILSGIFFFHYYLLIMSKNGINPRMLWSHVSLKGLIQHTSLER